MRNIKLTLEYDGTEFCGWQTQKRKSQKSNRKRTTIQETVEEVLGKILQEKVKVIGSGRTDSGVHALNQVANFKTKSVLPLKNIQKALNSVLPYSIAVVKIEEASADFHARFDAKSKTYRYSILNSGFNRPLLNNHFSRVPYKLNVPLMKKEIRHLLGKHDFKSFQARDKKERSSIRTISKINLSQKGNLIYLDVSADGFLYNMVRNIAGSLIEVGRGKLPQNSIKKMLLAKNRKSAGPTAPAKGLALTKVRY